MSENLKHFSTDDFEAEVLKSDIPVLVDFWAEWCGPCKMVAPILEQIASERDITIAKVNTDQNRNTPGRFGVRGIPTLVLFNEGQVADQRTGAASKPNLDSWLDQHMS